jgi:class 3 adenylate cyclase
VQKNAETAHFCNKCSRPLALGTATAPAGAEREQVSVLFCDLTGFTAIREKLDPVETRQIMARVFGLAAEIVGRYEGRIIDLCEARLLAHNGRRTEAREVLDCLRERLQRAGVDPSPGPVRELAAEIASC